MSTTNTTGRENIHAHDVLDLMATAGTAYTYDSLRAEAANRWGATAAFCTCSGVDMSFDELVGFLLMRGKVVERDGTLQLATGMRCEHDHHEKH